MISVPDSHPLTVDELLHDKARRQARFEQVMIEISSRRNAEGKLLGTPPGLMELATLYQAAEGAISGPEQAKIVLDMVIQLRNILKCSPLQ